MGGIANPNRINITAEIRSHLKSVVLANPPEFCVSLSLILFENAKIIRNQQDIIHQWIINIMMYYVFV